MEFIIPLIHAIELLLLFYFGSAAVYVFIFSFAGLFASKKSTKETIGKYHKFAVLIPGYKEDAVIVDVATKALEQEYPKDSYEVIIIADSFQLSTLTQLKKLPVKLVVVDFEVSTKSKALNKAMQVIGDAYDIALVLDADNIMNPDFIPQINHAFNKGFKVVQGHRIAKNMNTSFAILDAISEEVNNHIFRKGHRVLGLSSALIGSGMAFKYDFFKHMMASVKAVGGFDKELELKLLRDGVKIEYLHHALVYDEKVQKASVFANQRKRWLSAQFIYFKRFFFSGLSALLFKGNFDFFDKVYQMIAPPRVLLAGIVTLLTVVYVLLGIWFPNIAGMLRVSSYSWALVFCTVLLSFLMAIPSKFYSWKTMKALVTLPRAFLLMFLSLFRLKGANKKFIHTEHGIPKQ